MTTGIGMQGHCPPPLIWPWYPIEGAAAFGQNAKIRQTRTHATARSLQQRPATEQHARALTTASTIAMAVATATAVQMALELDGVAATIRATATANATQGITDRSTQIPQTANNATDATLISQSLNGTAAMMHGLDATVEGTGMAPPFIRRAFARRYQMVCM